MARLVSGARHCVDDGTQAPSVDPRSRAIARSGSNVVAMLAIARVLAGSSLGPKSPGGRRLTSVRTRKSRARACCGAVAQCDSPSNFERFFQRERPPSGATMRSRRHGIFERRGPSLLPSLGFAS
jgi:hypothetical protein